MTPLPFWDFIAVTRRLYPYEMTESEQQQRACYEALSTGQFLIDRDGVVRWANVQSATQPPAGLGDCPSEEELLAALQTLKG